MTTKETRLIRQTANRIRQALLDQATDVEKGEAVHQVLTEANVELIGIYQRVIGIYRCWKELGELIHTEIDALDAQINKQQAIEGHAYETLEDSRRVLHEFQNLQTLAQNLEPVLLAGIEKERNV